MCQKPQDSQLPPLPTGVLAPSKFASYDVVKLQRKFGDDAVEIISFRDENGKLIKRLQNTVDKNNQNISKQTNTYEYKATKEGNVRYIERTKTGETLTPSTTLENIKTTNKPDSKDLVTKAVFNKAGIEESSFWGRFKNGEEPKKLLIGAQRDQYDRIKLTKGKCSGIPKEQAAELIKNDPYLPVRLSPIRDFLSAIKYKVFRDQGITNSRTNLRFTDLPWDDIKNIGTLGNAGYTKDKSLIIRLNQKRFGVSKKSTLLNTFNHEARHCKQNILEEQLKYTKKDRLSPNAPIAYRQQTFGKLTNPEDIKLAEDFAQAKKNRVDSSADYDKYYSNFREVDARAAGAKAEEEYISLGKKLAKLFELTPNQAGLGV